MKRTYASPAILGTVFLFGIGCSQTPDNLAATATAERRAIVADAEELTPAIDTITRIDFANGQSVSSWTSALPPTAYQAAGPSYTKAESIASAPPSAIDPPLEAKLKRLEAGVLAQQTTEVVVTFKDTLRIPHLPALIEEQQRDSAANASILQKRQQLIAAVEQARAAGHAAHISEFATAYGAKSTGSFWLVNALSIRLPLQHVRSVAARADVQYVEEDSKGVPPPSNEMLDARNVLVTDPYRYLNSSFVGLLDTGVRATHTLMSPNLSIGLDCVNGTSNNCTTGSGLNPDDTDWNHGTSSAAEFMGNANLGNNMRGVTDVLLDSYKVYNNVGEVVSAVLRGFQAALAFGDRVIIAELQDPGGPTSSISTAADAAFDSLAVVVAAAGNSGSAAGSVTAPGNARKALAIGAADVNSLALQDYSGRGPTADGRTKPDLLGLTNVNTASNAFDTAWRQFSGTSAATPNAAGATALMRNLIRNAPDISPGYVNAFMILTGRNVTSAANDNNNGAGIIQCPTNGSLFQGAVTINPNQSVNVPLLLTGTIGFVDAALWWPETSTQTHSDVDLFLVDPSGIGRASSASGPSVFERARATTGLAAGTWKVRITAFNVSAPQVVHWAVFKHN